MGRRAVSRAGRRAPPRSPALAGLLGVSASADAAITYIYDELGRLRAVIDPSQTDGTAIYTYDAVGNILSITRQPASQVAIIEFNPKRGPVGTTVTIQGTGFGATRRLTLPLWNSFLQGLRGGRPAGRR